MKKHILVNSDFQASELGADSLLIIDNRLNNFNKVTHAKNHIKRIQNLNPSFGKTAVYIAPFDSCLYKRSKYIYSKLIKL